MSENFEYKHISPSEIEGESMRIISEILDQKGIVLDEINAPVIKRVIHTTADFSFTDTMFFSENAVEKAREMLKSGATIVTDTNMTLAGINKRKFEKLGVKVCCFMADEDVAKEAKERGVTRATVSMEKAAKIDGPVIYSVGNAPTALIELHRLIDASEKNKINGGNEIFIIGVPVGFVNVEYSKELFRNSEIPRIINFGRKGGSNVAAAIINAITLGLE